MDKDFEMHMDELLHTIEHLEQRINMIIEKLELQKIDIRNLYRRSEGWPVSNWPEEFEDEDD
jgi:hypothetical protein